MHAHKIIVILKCTRNAKYVFGIIKFDNSALSIFFGTINSFDHVGQRLSLSGNHYCVARTMMMQDCGTLYLLRGLGY